MFQTLVDCFFMTYMIHDMVETSKFSESYFSVNLPVAEEVRVEGISTTSGKSAGECLGMIHVYIQNDWIYIVNILFFQNLPNFKFRSFAFISTILQIHCLKVIIQNLLLFFPSLTVWNFSLQPFRNAQHHRPARRYHRRKLFASSNEELVEEWTGTSGRCSIFFLETSILGWKITDFI